MTAVYAGVAFLAAIIVARQALHELAVRRHWRIGHWSVVLPGWREIGCGRCGTSWRYVRAHATPYALAQGKAKQIAPLCDPCWQELGRPAARIDYYEGEYDMRRLQGDTTLSPADLTAIRAAVAAGL